MDNEITKTLELMCDKDNPQDKKLLLLAELVESRCGELSRNQAALKKCLESTNNKLDKLTGILERYEEDTLKCPVYNNRRDFENMVFIVQHPKVTLFVILGIIALLGGFFGSGITSIIKELFGI